MLTMPLPLVESQPVLVLSPGCECCFVPRQKSVVSPRWSWQWALLCNASDVLLRKSAGPDPPLFVAHYSTGR